MKKISFDDLTKYQENYDQKPVQNALRRVLMKNELSTLFDKQEQKNLTQFKEIINQVSFEINGPNKQIVKLLRQIYLKI